MIKTAIILVPDDNGLQPVFNIPVVRRLTLLTRRLGCEVVHLIGEVNPLTSTLSDLVPSQAFHQVKDPVLLDEVIEGLSLPEGERVLVLKANHVIDQHSLSRLIEVSDDSGLYFMKAGEKGDADGLYVTIPAHLVSILQSLWSPETFDLRILDKAQHLQGATGLPYSIKRGKEQIKIAEVKLIEALSDQTKADDGFLARHIDRKISRFISEKLVRTGMTPNQITLSGVAIGLIGAFLLSRPGYWFPLLGSLLFLFCVIVDGVDGEVARLKLQETTFGHYLDVITDNVVHAAIFVGIAFGLYHETGDRGYLLALWFIMGGFGLCLLAVYQCILKRSPDELKQSPRILRLMALVTNRDFAYLVVALAIVHRLNWFLIGSAVGTYVFAAILYIMTFHEKRMVEAK
jgi:phosphatidylglycerophosphate synthase